ncbi:MAG: hypothetical protein MMC23_008209 [Stictis urceolatum]|nr:hypothetical protein [Stictis urceolata]
MVSSVLPAPRPIGPGGSGGPRRPKLSLQTALQTQSPVPKVSQSAIPAPLTDSPTSRNTHANARGGFTLARSSPTSPRHSKSANASPRTSSPLTSTLLVSRVSQKTPYSLPQGTRPILKNSPFRSQISSPRSSQGPRYSQRPKKQVLFREALIEHMPTPVIAGSDSESETEAVASAAATEDLGEHGEIKMPHRPTPISRRKKQRDWVWTIGSDSPGEGKFLRGFDDKPIYPRTPIPGGEDSDSGSDSSENQAPLQVPLPITPGTPESPSQIPLPKTPGTPNASTPRTPSQGPLPATPLVREDQKR